MLLPCRFYLCFVVLRLLTGSGDRVAMFELGLPTNGEAVRCC